MFVASGECVILIACLATAYGGKEFVPEVENLEEEADDEPGATGADERALSHALHGAEEDKGLNL